MRRRLSVFGIALFAALGLLLWACDGAGETVVGNFAGAVSGTEAFFAIAAFRPQSPDRDVLAYICDGHELAEWFEGSIEGNDVELMSDGGARLMAHIGEETTRGTIILADGTELEFDAPLVKGENEHHSGIWRAEDTIGGMALLGGRVVLQSLEQRGAVKSGSTVISNPTLNIFNPIVLVSGGQLMAVWIDPSPDP